MDAETPETLSIGDLAASAGVTPRTVRYYVAEGLLPPPAGAGQRRAYTREHLLRLAAIKRLKEGYLPLGEIRRQLADLPPAELERLAESPDSPASAGREPLAPILPGTESRSARGLEPRARGLSEVPRLALGDHAAGESARRPLRLPPRPPELLAEAPGESVWRRVALAPGVELHYRPSTDLLRDAAIARLVRIASELLADLAPDEPHR